MSGHSMTVAALLAGDQQEGHLVKEEGDQMIVYTTEEENRARYYGGEETEQNSVVFEAESEGLTFEQLSEDSSQSVPDLEYHQESEHQDTVSFAMEDGNSSSDARQGWEETGEQITTQEHLLEGDGSGFELGEAADEEFPDEIECQLIQKNVMINGQVQTLDFIMCNQCPRLFRTETLLWNHIKVKHKRRTFRRPMTGSGGQDRQRIEQRSSLEPGEIQTSLNITDYVEPGAGSSSENIQRSSQQSISSRKEPVYVVGLEKSNSNREQEMIRGSLVSTEKFQRQRSRKRIYVDSSHGPFKCPGCDIVTFSNRKALDLHMKRVHKAGIMECDECGRKVLDLKRHKEILHKRFKIYNCPHCNDKYCTQEDLERHLMKVESNNFVKSNRVQLMQGEEVKDFNEGDESQEAGEPLDSKDGVVDNTFDQNDDGSEETEEQDDENAEELMKQMESKIYSCSECGLKTPSRMTYIQHVLNGCIMDMVLGETGQEDDQEGTPLIRGRKRDGLSSGIMRGGVKRRGRPPGSKNRAREVTSVQVITEQSQ